MIVTPDLSRAPLERSAAPAKEMLSLKFDEAGKAHVRVNSSSLSILQTCWRKSFYLLHEGLRAKAEAPATCFGTAVHKALEVFYREPRENRELPQGFAKNADLIIAQDDYAQELEASHFLYRALGEFCRSAEPLRMLPESAPRSLNAGVWSLTHYFQTYIDDPFVVLCDDQGPVTERRCEALLYNSPDLAITVHGQLDVVLSNVRTGVILPTDHKTSSVVGNDFYARLKPNHQYTCYTWLARECLKLDVDSFMVNCIQVKARPTTSRGQPPHFPRQVTRRTEEDILEWKEAVITATESYVRRVRSSGPWPLGDVNACSMYGGCSFQPVCSSPSSLRESIIEATFLKGNTDATK